MQETFNSKPTQPEVSPMPHVSVIMPSYNAAPYIAEAIDSVLSQDYPNKELIVIDDGSTDNTVEIVRAYEARLRLIRQENQGSAVARNAGLAASQGELIAFLDSDDCWLPGKLTAQVSYLRDHPEIGVVFSRWQVWKPDPDGGFRRPLIPEREKPSEQRPKIVPERSGWLYNRLLFSSLLHTITVMARRTLIEQVGEFDPQLKRGQDYDYWIRASRVSEIHQLNTVFALYRIHGQGCVKKWPTVNYELQVVEQALARWGLTGPDGERTRPAAIRRRLADASFSFGYYQYWEGDLRLAFQSFKQSIRNDVWRVSTWRYLVMSLFEMIVLKRGITQRNKDVGSKG
ncbi:glycosyltransferase [Thiorhodococcus mannitoliphagus]|uniref:Glycosyltransferase n=1 Tax=Thiorhodococcus mannitoliphagus TaxID=329406 RepID=A0A6P1E013_9GAMM|nr:glycosyltransferase [Thiorhodococcus mannitoliphagus]NEX22623.1 glycosyltransferase [Thiorhodococcus mannitoliphagus]